MLAKVTSCALIGLDGVPITVEVDVGAGMPPLRSSACRMRRAGGKERVRAAIRNSGGASRPARHRQPRPGGHPQRGAVLRSAHRSRHSARLDAD